MDIYNLSRNFWNFSFENPEKIKPNHCAVYFFAIEHCNRLGWKKKFGFPTAMVMDAIGIKSYTTYISILNDLVSFGFIEMIEKSKNQYSSNIIALPEFDNANDKPLDKAIIKHASKQLKSTCESNVSIDIPINNDTNTPINKEIKNYYRVINHLKLENEEFEKLLELGYSKIQIDEILDSIENFKDNKKYKSLFLTAKNWLKNEQKYNELNSKPKTFVPIDYSKKIW